MGASTTRLQEQWEYSHDLKSPFRKNHREPQRKTDTFSPTNVSTDHRRYNTTRKFGKRSSINIAEKHLYVKIIKLDKLTLRETTLNKTQHYTARVHTINGYRNSLQEWTDDRRKYNLQYILNNTNHLNRKGQRIHNRNNSVEDKQNH